MQERQTNMKKHGLNGNTWWISLALTVIVQTGAIVYWAGGLNSTVKELGSKLEVTAQEIKELRKEDLATLYRVFSDVKADIKVLQERKR